MSLNLSLKNKLNNPSLVIIVLTIGVFASLLILINLSPYAKEQQFSYLARAFLEGHTYFTESPGTWNDTTLFSGEYYWPLGLFPALLLLPFVAFFNQLGIFFTQGYLNLLIVPAIFLLWVKISKKIGFTATDSLYLAFAFCAGSVFLDVAFVPFSWYFAQVITTLFLSLAIYEFLTKKRFWLIGIYLAAVLMTRQTAAIGAVFFILAILSSNEKMRAKTLKLLSVSAPLIIAAMAMLFYNYLRFNNLFETGYVTQLLIEPLTRARFYGLFSFSHIPGNLYYFLLQPPLPVFYDGISHVLRPPYLKPSPWGMSILITSPYYLYLIWGNYRERITKIIWSTVIATAIPIFMYYGIGYIQFGHRYSLDFLPFLFLLFLLTLFKKSPTLSLPFKTLFVANGLTNFYLFFALRYLN